MKSVYVDGCSYVAGYGLEKQYSLASLLSKHYEVYDASRVGKSNYAIALDVYNQNKSYDYYVIGWTYSTRFEFNLDGNIVDASLSRDNIHLGAIKNGEYLEKEYALLQGKFFKYFSRLSTFNDYLIDS